MSMCSSGRTSLVFSQSDVLLGSMSRLIEVLSVVVMGLLVHSTISYVEATIPPHLYLYWRRATALKLV
jgi:hypothetical protein